MKKKTNRGRINTNKFVCDNQIKGKQSRRLYVKKHCKMHGGVILTIELPLEIFLKTFFYRTSLMCNQNLNHLSNIVHQLPISHA